MKPLPYPLRCLNQCFPTASYVHYAVFLWCCRMFSIEKEAKHKRQMLVWCGNYRIQNGSEARRWLPGSVAPVLNIGNKLDTTNVTGHWSDILLSLLSGGPGFSSRPRSLLSRLTFLSFPQFF